MNMSLSAVWSFLSLFNFLFILCVFHIMHLNSIHFPLSSYPPSASDTTPQLFNLNSGKYPKHGLYPSCNYSPLTSSAEPPKPSLLLALLPSQLLLGSPSKAYLQHSTAFLIQSPNVFHIPLNHWFSGFLMLQLFNTIPHVVVTPTINLLLFLHHHCNFAIMNHKVNIWYLNLLKGFFDTPNRSWPIGWELLL